MPGLQIIITNAGRAALVNAEHNGTAPLKITEIGITAAVFTAGKETTALPGEIKRLSTISGEVVAPDTLHVTIRDDGTDTYTVRGIGYWLSNGVLLGVYSQPDPILQKSTQSMMLLAADVVFTDIKATSLTFGDANFTNPPATVERQGVVELATPVETVAGTDGTRAVTPAGLAPALVKAIADHKSEADPHTQYLTPERGNLLYFRKLAAVTNSDTDCATLLDTGVRDVTVANDRGVITATGLPTDAEGYGTLTTANGGQFVRQVYSEGTTARRTWERTGYLGSTPPFFGRGWKLLWDSVTFDPNTKQDKLGFTPVQQGTGIGQTSNIVKVGWSDGAGLKATVDKTDQGSFVFGDRAIRLNWNGLAGQPPYLLGGAAAGDVNLYDPLNFNVNSAQKASTVTNGADWMKFMWGDSGGQTSWVWGSDSPTSARLMTTNNLRVGYARSAGVADVVDVKDTRDSNFAPQDRSAGVFFDMKNGTAIGINDSSMYISAMTIRAWGTGGDFSGGNAHQLGFSDTSTVWYRSGKTSAWGSWYKFWHSGNFDPGAKVNGLGITLKWNGFDGQPTWLFGGNTPGDVNVYNPSNFKVAFAASAGTSTNAENISNGNSYMRLAWSDPGGQPTYLWGSDGPTAARLAVIGNLNVGHAREADNASKVGGVPMRFSENPGEQPYYVYGTVAGRVEMTLFNRSSMAVGSAVNATYANQLSGQGLGYGGVGGYVLNKNKSGTGLAGGWEQRGQVYDFGSGAAEGNESSAVLWQRVW
ncbi:hypothetical protein GN109_01575 [Collimonas pratensis]|uniref:hypothetical protein n=1 Tax=Collimonas pratensis TaxID=279113 RepID=UPI00143D88D2|nr:hypothetical protein [Collimonas pratensis]NKI68095.1 hypothetical protein [Collimonas pratensis]